jgi:WXG100 family type VII secretion target
MGRFTVDPASLHGLESTIAARVEHSRADLIGLRTTAAELHWRGGAAVDFRAGWAEWVGGVERLLAALQELGAAVGMSATDYAAAETQVCVAVDGTPS